MKRAPFLGASAVVLLYGCGGSHVLRALPGVAPATHNSGPGTFSGTLVPVSADPIPNNVLAGPIIGEAWRFDGATPPPGWMAANGQTLSIADNPRLFAVLGTVGGGNGKTTFAVPKSRAGYIVAAAGMAPTSPAMLAASGRRFISQADSLRSGTSILARRVTTSPARERAISEAQKLRMSAPSFSPARPVPMAAELVSRIVRTRAATREIALSNVSRDNVTAIQSLLDGVAAGSISLNDAVVSMIPRLSQSEASALLETNDAYLRAFRERWYGALHENPQLEAARFLVSIAFSDEQRRAFLSHQQ